MVLDNTVETDDIVPIYYTLLDIVKKYEVTGRVLHLRAHGGGGAQGHYMIKDLKLLVPLVNIVLLGFLFLFFRNFRGTVSPLTSVAQHPSGPSA